MNEENGNMGGKTYAKWVKEKGEKHIAAIESDRGGFAPRGFTCDGNNSQLAWLKLKLHYLTPTTCIYLIRVMVVLTLVL